MQQQTQSIPPTTAVKLPTGIVTWESIATPEGDKRELSIAFEPNHPALNTIQAGIGQALAATPWGGIPPGGHQPMRGPSDAVAAAIGPHMQVFKMVTWRMPTVLIDGRVSKNPMEWAGQLYTGQQVEVVVQFQPYGLEPGALQKGVRALVAGINILAAAGAPQLNIGGGGMPESELVGMFQGQQPPAYGQAPQGQQPPAYDQAPQGQQPPAYGQAPSAGGGLGKSTTTTSPSSGYAPRY